MTEPTSEDFEKLAERLAKEGKGAIYRVGQELAKLLEEHQPKTSTFRSPLLSEERYNELMESQEGRCAICGMKPEARVEHDHATGQVRGLLCQSCNVALGFLRDDPNRLKTAIAYLENPPAGEYLRNHRVCLHLARMRLETLTSKWARESCPTHSVRMRVLRTDAPL